MFYSKETKEIINSLTPEQAKLAREMYHRGAKESSDNFVSGSEFLDIVKDIIADPNCNSKVPLENFIKRWSNNIEGLESRLTENIDADEQLIYLDIMSHFYRGYDFYQMAKENAVKELLSTTFDIDV